MMGPWWQIALLAAAGGAGAASPEAPFFDRPPLIAAVRGPAESAWSGCAILLEGRSAEDPPPQVSMLCDVAGKPAFRVLASVAPRSHALSAEKGAAGELRILVGRPGGIDEIRLESTGAAPSTASLIEDDALEPYWLGDRPDLDGDGRLDLLQAVYDGVALWRREQDGRMTRLPGPHIPPFAQRTGGQVTVSGPRVLAPLPPAPLRFTWPETMPGRRLRIYRVPLTPGASDACAAWIDTESQLYASSAVFLSGEPPRLVALVGPSDKVTVFGNLSLLVAPLACDATARGKPASLLLKTEFDENIGWANLGVRDLTGDGLPDVGIVGRKGLLNGKLQVEVHAADAQGGFTARPCSGTRSDLDPLGAVWDQDVDGDGRLDLVVLDARRVMLARGIAVDGARDLPFDLRKPLFVALPEALAPRSLSLLVDFDGDGRLEALIAGEERGDEDGKSGLRVSLGNARAAEKDARLAIVRFPAAPR